MRARASILTLIAVVAACGHEIDTTVHPGPADAGTPTDSAASTGIDATTSAEASVGDDDDTDAMTDADPDAATDAMTDAAADADADANIVCPSFTDMFTAPWSPATNEWTQSLPSPYVDVSTQKATFQSSTAAMPYPFPTLAHTLPGGCSLHLSMSLTTSATTSQVHLTVLRVSVNGVDLDFYRFNSGVFTGIYGAKSFSIGQFSATQTYTLIVNIPATTGGTIGVNFGGVEVNTKVSISANSAVGAFKFGVVDAALAGPADNVTFSVDADNVVVSPN